MPNTEPPTPGELMRILGEIRNAVADLAREIKEDRATAAATYMRRDVYIAERQAANAVVSDLQTDITKVDGKVEQVNDKLEQERKARQDQRDTDAAARRTAWLAIGTTAVMALIAIAGLIINSVR